MIVNLINSTRNIDSINQNTNNVQNPVKNDVQQSQKLSFALSNMAQLNKSLVSFKSKLKIDEAPATLDEIEFKNGVAYKDDKTYTGAVEYTSKQGDNYIFKYDNGSIYKSYKNIAPIIDFEDNYEKTYVRDNKGRLTNVETLVYKPDKSIEITEKQIPSDFEIANDENGQVDIIRNGKRTARLTPSIFQDTSGKDCTGVQLDVFVNDGKTILRTEQQEGYDVYRGPEKAKQIQTTLANDDKLSETYLLETNIFAKPKDDDYKFTRLYEAFGIKTPIKETITRPDGSKTIVERDYSSRFDKIIIRKTKIDKDGNEISKIITSDRSLNANSKQPLNWKKHIDKKVEYYKNSELQKVLESSYDRENRILMQLLTTYPGGQKTLTLQSQKGDKFEINKAVVVTKIDVDNNFVETIDDVPSIEQMQQLLEDTKNRKVFIKTEDTSETINLNYFTNNY